MKIFAFLTIAAFSVVRPSAAQVVNPIIANAQTPYSQLISFLSLTSTQVQSLEQIQQQRNQAVQSIYQQVYEKQTELNTQLNSSSPNPVQVGQLMIDIRALQQQAQQASKPFRQPALAVLTPAQTNQLAALAQALQLQPAASQAISLNLIDSQVMVTPYAGGGLIVPVGTPQPAPTSQDQK